MMIVDAVQILRDLQLGLDEDSKEDEPLYDALEMAVWALED